jgi:hypothetical protein
MNAFKDAQYMTAAEKTLTLRQWKTFLKRLATADTAPTTGADCGYFPSTLDAVFTDRLYKFLSCYSGFIAHYNRRGFLSARFHDSADIRATFDQLRTRGYWGGYQDYADLGAALVVELDAAAPAFAKRWARESAAAQDVERAELARLSAKYGAR